MAFASKKILETNSSQSVDHTHEIVLADSTSGDITITLPSGDVTRMVFTIKSVGSGGNTVTISRNGNNIEGAGNDVTLADKDGVRIAGSSTGWWLIPGGGI